MIRDLSTLQGFPRIIIAVIDFVLGSFAFQYIVRVEGTPGRIFRQLRAR